MDTLQSLADVVYDPWIEQVPLRLYDGEKLAARLVAENADVLINLSGVMVLREEHLRIPVRVYLETDPVLPQIEVAQGRRFTIEFLDPGVHAYAFTFG